MSFEHKDVIIQTQIQITNLILSFEHKDVIQTQIQITNMILSFEHNDVIQTQIQITNLILSFEHKGRYSNTNTDYKPDFVF